MKFPSIDYHYSISSGTSELGERQGSSRSLTCSLIHCRCRSFSILSCLGICIRNLFQFNLDLLRVIACSRRISQPIDLMLGCINIQLFYQANISSTTISQQSVGEESSSTNYKVLLISFSAPF
ncbi:hypothetical protein MTR67_003576 [Solanum verrucosum]|uniref:Uncharacterized protein n=1 Tax=Solanum verrucosum TaxID=315347 RepID=A0AAF0T9G4_SOLVR|nr:hypothetical protein MTR67_003576 [Solanum verrucosum]